MSGLFDQATMLLLAAAGERLPGDMATEWESLGTNIFRLCVIMFFVLLNGFFVAAEFAIVKVRVSQLNTLEEHHEKAAKIAKEVTARLDAFLSATQLGITLASIALGYLAKPFLEDMISPLFFKLGVTSTTAISAVSFILAYSIVTFLHIVIGELLPKSIAIRKALPTTLWVARPLRFFYFIFKPAIWLFNGAANQLLWWFFRIDPISESELVHSADELRILVEGTHGTGEVTETEREILINALELNDLTVRDVMTPRNEVDSLDLEKSFEENLELALDTLHTRFPLVQGHLDKTVGLVHIKDVLPLMKKEAPDLMAIKRDILPVPELMPLDKLLKTFLEKHAHIALVVDEFGGALGIVTLDDVLIELVGDIQDEFDTEESDFRRVSDDEFIVDGAFGLHELSDHTDLYLDSPDVSTVGGYVTHLIGHLPAVGDSVDVENYQATVTQSDGRSVGEVRFRRLQKTGGDKGSKGESKSEGENERLSA